MSTAGIMAIVPVKALSGAKSRLAPVLSPEARRRLTLEMLTDVLTVLFNSDLDRILVVTPDDEVVASARNWGAEVLIERPVTELNEAVRAGLGVAKAARMSRALVVPADVPLLSVGEVDAVFQSPARVVLVPSADGGTNALFMSPFNKLELAYGPDSCARHLQAAHEHGLTTEVLTLPGLGADIDRPADLDRLIDVPRYSWLRAEIASAQASSTTGANGHDAGQRRLQRTDRPDLGRPDLGRPGLDRPGLGRRRPR